MLLERLLDDLIESNQEDIQRLRGMAPYEDLAALGGLAHKMKGGARLVNARQLVRHCEALEQACEQLLSNDEIQRRVAALLQTMQAMDTSLASLLRSTTEGE